MRMLFNIIIVSKNWIYDLLLEKNHFQVFYKEIPGGEFSPNTTFYLTTYFVFLMTFTTFKHSAVHFSVSCQTLCISR